MNFCPKKINNKFQSLDPNSLIICKLNHLDSPKSSLSTLVLTNFVIQITNSLVVFSTKSFFYFRTKEISQSQLFVISLHPLFIVSGHVLQTPVFYSIFIRSSAAYIDPCLLSHQIANFSLSCSL